MLPMGSDMTALDVVNDDFMYVSTIWCEQRELHVLLFCTGA